MKDLHEAGFKKEDILEALRILPFVRRSPQNLRECKPDMSSTLQ